MEPESAKMPFFPENVLPDCCPFFMIKTHLGPCINRLYKTYLDLVKISSPMMDMFTHKRCIVSDSLNEQLTTCKVFSWVPGVTAHLGVWKSDFAVAWPPRTRSFFWGILLLSSGGVIDKFWLRLVMLSAKSDPDEFLKKLTTRWNLTIFADF